MKQALTLKAPRACNGYREIADVLTHEIQSGAWVAGSQLPAEADLVERFGASRNTVRESLRQLGRQGYIRRQRGSRSVVVSSTPIESFVNSIESIEDIMNYSTDTEPRIVATDMIIVDEAMATQIGVLEGSQWLRVELLRISAGTGVAVGYSQIYIDPRYVAICERLSESTPLYRMLAEQFGLEYIRVEQIVEAEAASPGAASLLEVAPGSAIMRVRTEFVCQGDEVVEIAFGHFPARSYRLEIALERRDAKAGD
jgi:GntR family transcriptional regulator